MCVCVPITLKDRVYACVCVQEFASKCVCVSITLTRYTRVLQRPNRKKISCETWNLARKYD